MRIEDINLDEILDDYLEFIDGYNETSDLEFWSEEELAAFEAELWGSVIENETNMAKSNKRK